MTPLYSAKNAIQFIVIELYGRLKIMNDYNDTTVVETTKKNSFLY